LILPAASQRRKVSTDTPSGSLVTAIAILDKFGQGRV
jgi:hypothetical protein